MHEITFVKAYSEFPAFLPLFSYIRLIVISSLHAQANLTKLIAKRFKKQDSIQYSDIKT